MDFVRSDNHGARTASDEETNAPVALKILIAGGFGVGKTTLVGTVTQIRPLHTEERLTESGRFVDDLSGVEAKTTTTVAMDFGRIDIREGLAVYLFGTPGQDRFWFLWDELAVGAMGAVVLADTRRLDACFPAVDFFESRGIPFIVGVNHFDGARQCDVGEVRHALDLDTDIPVLSCDVRLREDDKQLLITLVEYAVEFRHGPRGESPPAIRASQEGNSG